MSHEASVGIGVGIDAGVGFSICHGDVSPARLCWEFLARSGVRNHGQNFVIVTVSVQGVLIKVYVLLFSGCRVLLWLRSGLQCVTPCFKRSSLRCVPNVRNVLVWILGSNRILQDQVSDITLYVLTTPAASTSHEAGRYPLSIQAIECNLDISWLDTYVWSSDTLNLTKPVCSVFAERWKWQMTLLIHECQPSCQEIKNLCIVDLNTRRINFHTSGLGVDALRK